MRTKAAFTLIELMLVIAIIAVLMALLLPAVGAVQRTLLANSTSTRLTIISGAIDQYAQIFDGAYPPSSGDTSWTYPLGVVEGSSIGYNPNRPCYSHTRGNLGGHNLVYFLMGPERIGWDKGVHGVKNQWMPPDALRKMVGSTVMGVSDVNDPQHTVFYGFNDSWGPDGTKNNTSGSIQYCLAGGRNPTYNRHDLSSAYYWGGPREDEVPYVHIERLMKNLGSHKYVLLSAGPDRKFGYYIWNEEKKRYSGNAATGTSDDIANIAVD